MLPAVLNMLTTLGLSRPSRWAAMLTPPAPVVLAATLALALAVVLALSLRGRVAL